MFTTRVLFLLVTLAWLSFTIAVSVVKNPKVLARAYIAEFAEDYNEHSFLQDLDIVGVLINKRMTLNSSLLNGLSFQILETLNDLTIEERISNLPKVKHLWPIHEYASPKHDVLWAGTDTSNLQPPISKRGLSEKYPPHVLTQVEELQAEGVTGAGIKLAIIDSGIDYSHPLLGGCFGEGCLVGYGFDLVGDAYNGKNTPLPDPDPMDCAGHGTHIAGIIAAQKSDYGFVGAAPGVTLGAYRVYGCIGRGVTNDVLISAFMKAYEDGSNIITASIGVNGGWPYDIWTLAVERIVDAGIPCLLSIGNDGQNGPFMPNGAAHGKNVVAVGSYDNTYFPTVWSNASYKVDHSPPRPFTWTVGDPAGWPNLSLPLLALSYDVNNSDDGCATLPSDTPNLSGYIVLLRRGNCDFSTKAANAVARGAQYIMFYSNSPSVYSPGMVTSGLLGTGMITADQGNEFINILKNGSEVVLQITEPATASQYVTFRPNNITGGQISTYTSWGPTFELDVKPQFGAPGGWILSTYPLSKGGFAVASGTSMACPLVAAIYALIAEVRHTFDPTTLKNLLSATAKPSAFNDGNTTYSYLAPVPQQGGGMVQAYKAAYATTLLSTASLSFNDTTHFLRDTNFSITNYGRHDVSYKMSHMNAATAYTLPLNSIFPAKFPPELVQDHADIQFGAPMVTVPAGESRVVRVSAFPPAIDSTRLGVYSGYIGIEATNGESFHIPYIGVVGSMRNATVLAKGYLYNSTDDGATPVSNETNYKLPTQLPSVKSDDTRKSDLPRTAIPAVKVNLALGSPLLRIDVIPSLLSNSSTNQEGRGLGTGQVN
ncbi:minor extracellular protease vpr [Pyrenophora teres f. maculata]|nr:minor extracellular protease vpr [Pyrenophora teres f. maculata]